MYGTQTWVVMYFKKHIVGPSSVNPDEWEMLVILTWACGFRFWWSWAIFGSSGHSITGNRGTWRQPPDANAVVLNISHLHLGWFVNFYKQKQGETSEAPVGGDKNGQGMIPVLVGTERSLITLSDSQVVLWQKHADGLWEVGPVSRYRMAASYTKKLYAK